MFVFVLYASFYIGVFAVKMNPCQRISIKTCPILVCKHRQIYRTKICWKETFSSNVNNLAWGIDWLWWIESIFKVSEIFKFVSDRSDALHNKKYWKQVKQLFLSEKLFSVEWMILFLNTRIVNTQDKNCVVHANYSIDLLKRLFPSGALATKYRFSIYSKDTL